MGFPTMICMHYTTTATSVYSAWALKVAENHMARQGTEPPLFFTPIKEFPEEETRHSAAISGSVDLDQPPAQSSGAGPKAFFRGKRNRDRLKLEQTLHGNGWRAQFRKNLVQCIGDKPGDSLRRVAVQRGLCELVEVVLV